MNTLILYIDFIYYTLTDPEKLSLNIINNKRESYIVSLLIIFIISFFDILSQSLISIHDSSFYYKITYGLIALSLTNIIISSAYAALINSTLQLLDYESNINFCFNIMALSQIPRMFLLPFVSIFVTLKFAPASFFILGLIISFIIQIYIITRCISFNHKLEFFKALFYTILPAITISIAGILIIISGVITIINII